jgi:magnesium-protoporphyrin O-methyltransferase
MSRFQAPTLPTAAAYLERRDAVREYFDRTAADAWVQLTGDAPVGRIRARVRAGRAVMRQRLSSWLPRDLHDRRVLDAGCGTGLLAVDLARRGARVTAIDLSPTLVEMARVRLPEDVEPRRVSFLSGDMLDPALGCFDHAVAMDSLIHYGLDEAMDSVAALAPRVGVSMLLTFVPRTPLLAVAHSMGRLFPRANRSPAVQPVTERAYRAAAEAHPALADWRWARSERVSAPFYSSQAVELVRA